MASSGEEKSQKSMNSRGSLLLKSKKTQYSEII